MKAKYSSQICFGLAPDLTLPIASSTPSKAFVTMADASGAAIDPAISSLLEKLAASHGITDESRLSAAHALLSATMDSSPSLQDGGVLMRNLIQRLISDGRKAEATRFAQVAAALTVEPALAGGGSDSQRGRSSWAIMYLLSCLLGSEDEVSEREVMPVAFDPPDELGGNANGRGAGGVGRGYVGGEGEGEEDEDGEDAEDYFDADGNPTAASMRAARRTTEAGRSGSLAVPEPRVRGAGVVERRGGAGVGGSVEDKTAASVTSRAAEVLLVRDIMLVVQGEDGSLVRFPSDDDGAVDDGGGVLGGDGSAGSPPDAARAAAEAAAKRRRAALRDLNDVVDILPLPSGGGEGSAEMPVSPSTAHVVRCIAELGFLYRVIYRRLRSVDEKPGLVAANFCSAVEREMESYYRSLATFHTGVEVPDDELPSLRAVFVWAEVEKPRLRWLARLCEETSGLHGGQTLAHLRSYHKSYVAADIRGMLSRIIAHTAAPLDLMLVRWITEGVLVDPHHEFYVMEDPKVAAAAASATAAVGGMEASSPATGARLVVGGPNAASSASHRIWWGLFKVRREMIPGALSRNVVENTLVAGKSIAFLRRCCGDASWVDQMHAPALSAYLDENSRSGDLGTSRGGSGGVRSARGFTLGSGLLDQDPRLTGTDHVGELVRRAGRSASVRLKTLFFDKFDLSHHFAAIKNYLLLSQGDFTQALMDSLAPMLDGDGRILRNNITGLLDSALRGSSGFNPSTDSDISERLDVQILAEGDKDSVGWDVFSLTYRVEDAPLNTVFSTKVMDAYLRIFRFLWRLKRIDHVLSRGFIELRELDCVWQRRRRWRASNDNAELDEGDLEATAEAEVLDIVKRANFLRVKMSHVLQNLQYYCTFEVLEGNWKVLLDEMSRAEDIDSLIQAHARYLATIQDRTLLSERSQAVARTLDSVLDSMLAFRETQQQLCDWGLSLRSEDNLAGNERVAALHASLEAVETSFGDVFAAFLDGLVVHTRTVGSIMFLLFRLDYNGYFASRALERKGGESDSASGEVLGDGLTERTAALGI